MKPFPAPLEVDRELYEQSGMASGMGHLFPAPREVNRELYFDCPGIEIEEVEWFPSPREVDRELYFTVEPDGLITTK